MAPVSIVLLCKQTGYSCGLTESGGQIGEEVRLESFAAKVLVGQEGDFGVVVLEHVIQKRGSATHAPYRAIVEEELHVVRVTVAVQRERRELDVDVVVGSRVILERAVDVVLIALCHFCARRQAIGGRDERRVSVSGEGALADDDTQYCVSTRPATEPAYKRASKATQQWNRDKHVHLPPYL